MKLKIAGPAIVASLLAATSISMAAGFKINEQSASGAGNAYAGQAAITDDASVVFYNPAGMVRLKKQTFTAGMAYINLEGEFEGEGTNRAGYDIENEHEQSGDFILDAYIPFMYFAQPITDKWYAGVGIFSPLGTGTNYDDNSVGAAYADKTSIKSLDIQPTVAYKFDDNFSVGGGLDFLSIRNQQSKQQDLIPYNPAFITNPDVSNPDNAGYENRSQFTGKGSGVGWNLGLLWQNDERSIALAYRSQIDMTLEGEVELLNKQNVQVLSFDDTGTPFLQTLTDVKDEDAEVDFSSPQSATLSYSEKVTSRLRFLAGTTWTGYSSFEYYDIRSTEDEPGPIANLASLGDGYLTHVVEKWDDDWAYSIGLDYQATGNTILRMGYAIDQSPISNNYRIMRQPGNDRRWFTMGFGHSFTPTLSMDFAAAYLQISGTEVEETAYDLEDEEIDSRASFSGEHDITGYGISMQINYQI